MVGKLIKEVRGHLLVYLLFLAMLVGGLYVRIYRVNEILGFYYDQGRDALIVWDLWHKGKLFLVGPTTGIAGIFRGPFYYYLIAPFYLLGGGNPVYPAVFLAVLSVLAVVLIYYLGFKIQGRVTGLIAAILASFSFNLVMASRWLSNPTPMLLLSLILVWMMFLVSEGRKWAWVVIAAVAGLSLFHFGSAGEVFYFVALLIFFVWQVRRRSLPKVKILVASLVVLLLMALPLVLFDLKHQGILRMNIYKFLVTDKSFQPPSWQFVWAKLEFYWDVFSTKIFHGRYDQERILLITIFASLFFYLQKLWKNDKVKILLLLLVCPLLGLIFFQGNFGNFYDYYLTGYYLIFLLLIGVVLGSLWQSRLGKVFLIYFFFVFFKNNLEVIKYKITGQDGPNTISFISQKKALDWIYADAGGKDFNVDVYVPPVIPYAYDYLFRWYGGGNYGREPMIEKVPILYTLYEVDPPNPDRLDAWLARQKGIGRVEKEARFGGITIQRRLRYEKD